MRVNPFPRALILLTIFMVSCTPVSVTPVITATSPAVSADTPAASAAVPQAIATSRGPNLEASDPGSVSLASGGLQLVEFFRFT